MLCTQCGLRLPNKPDGTQCIICGGQIIPACSDILTDTNIVPTVRKSQIKMAELVERALLQEKNIDVLIEGGTGIGKSYGYLVPTLLNSSVIIVSTSNKALQDQLVEKDIPYLLNKMGIPRKIVSVKGRSNYLCPKKIPKIRHLVSPTAIDAFTRSLENRPVEYGECPDYLQRNWKKISAKDCPLKKCGMNCTPTINWSSDEIVVINHHALMYSLHYKYRNLTDVPEKATLVIDEAHNLENALRDAFTETFSPSAIETAISWYAAISGQLPNGQALETLQEPLIDLLGGYKKLIQAFPEGENLLTVPYSGKLVGEIHNISVLCEELSACTFPLPENKKEEKEEFSKIMESIRNNVSILVSFASNIQGHLRTHVLIRKEDSLQLIPLILDASWNIITRALPIKIFASATLAVDRKFDRHKKLFGIERCYTGIYSSPFPIRENSVLYAPLNIPPPEFKDGPARTQWLQCLAQHIYDMFTAVRGNYFVLFSSKRDMLDTVQHLDRSIQRVLVIQENSATQALEEYKKTPGAVLFGLKSFWEGVDLPGEALRAVTITKLPFAAITDPLHKAIKDITPDSFNTIDLPEMVLDLKQGLGRLLRTHTDKGIISIADIRIWVGALAKHPGKLSSSINLIKAKPNPKPHLHYGGTIVNSIGYAGNVISTQSELQRYTDKFFPVKSNN